ncbi:hypothetical protein HK101_005710 [Irineochytrium annulatum]|nr:hypothetical protein HK101_005710 [Irineochytrium annulatum]
MPRPTSRGTVPRLFSILILGLLTLCRVDALTVSTSTVENCGGGNSHLNVLSAIVQYEASPTGGILVIGANVTSDVNINSGSAQVSALILGHQFNLENDKFCSLASCPIEPFSKFLVHKNISVSQVPPPGIEVQVRIVVTNDNVLLGCFNIHFDFVSTPYETSITAVSVGLVVLSAVLGGLSILIGLAQAFSETAVTGTGQVAGQAGKGLAGPSEGGGGHVGARPHSHHPGGHNAGQGATHGSPGQGGSGVQGGSGGQGAVHGSGGHAAGQGATHGPSNAQTGSSAHANPNVNSGSDAHSVGANNGHTGAGQTGHGGGSAGNAHTGTGGQTNPGVNSHTGGAGHSTGGAGNTHTGTGGATHGGQSAYGPGGASGPAGPTAYGPGGAAGPAGPTAYGPGGAAAPGGPTAYGPGGGLGGGGGVPGAGGATGVGHAAGATSSGQSVGSNYMSSPWFFDVLHYFQFITLSGQLQMDYPSVFATFTRLFHFSNGGVRVGFVDGACKAWTGVSSDFSAASGGVGTTGNFSTMSLIGLSDVSLGTLVDGEDVGLSSFIIQSGMQPANFFPSTLIMMSVMVVVMFIGSVVAAFGMQVYGDAKGWWKKRQGGEEEEGELKAAGGDRYKRREEKIKGQKRAVMVRFCEANLLRAWMISQYPLTASAAYWMSHYAIPNPKLAPISITIAAVFVLVVFSIGVPATILTTILRVRPRDQLFIDKRWMETVGPLYEQLRQDRIWFACVGPIYYGLQGLIVGGFPKNSPRVLVETMGTKQWIMELVQPLCLCVVEIAFMVCLFRADPYSDRFSGRIQWAVSICRLLVLLCVASFAAPEYKAPIGDNPTSAQLRANYSGDSVWQFKDIMGYIAALVHVLLMVSLLVLVLRRVYLWLQAFIQARRAASKASSSSDGTEARLNRQNWDNETMVGSAATLDRKGDFEEEQPAMPALDGYYAHKESEAYRYVDGSHQQPPPMQQQETFYTPPDHDQYTHQTPQQYHQQAQAQYAQQHQQQGYHPQQGEFYDPNQYGAEQPHASAAGGGGFDQGMQQAYYPAHQPYYEQGYNGYQGEPRY